MIGNPGGAMRRQGDREVKRGIMRQPGKSRLFCVCGNHVAGTWHRTMSGLGAGRHPALPLSTPLAWGGNASSSAARPSTAPYWAGQHAAGNSSSLSASLKACAARIERGMAKWQR